MTPDLVELLRDRGVCGNDHGDAKHLMLDAADELDRLRAEVERMRPVIEAAEAFEATIHGGGMLRYWAARDALEDALDALRYAAVAALDAGEQQ